MLPNALAWDSVFETEPRVRRDDFVPPINIALAAERILAEEDLVTLLRRE